MTNFHSSGCCQGQGRISGAIEAPFTANGAMTQSLFARQTIALYAIAWDIARQGMNLLL